jgi:hypothetical protein
MINTTADLKLYELDKKDEQYWEKVNSIIKENLGLDVNEIKQVLCNNVKERAQELAVDLPNLAPYNDYSKMLENNDDMTQFIQTDVSKVENWILYQIEDDLKNNKLLKFTFKSTAVDDGETVSGLVFISKAGKIRHAFAVADS